MLWVIPDIRRDCISEMGQEPTFSPALPQVRSAPKSGHPRPYRLQARTESL